MKLKVIMKVYVIVKRSFSEEEGTNASLYGVITAENLSEMKKEMKKMVLKDFETKYEEDELVNITIEESETSVRAYFVDGFDEVEMYAIKTELNEVTSKEIFIV